MTDHPTILRVPRWLWEMAATVLFIAALVTVAVLGHELVRDVFVRLREVLLSALSLVGLS